MELSKIGRSNGAVSPSNKPTWRITENDHKGLQEMQNNSEVGDYEKNGSEWKKETLSENTSLINQTSVEIYCKQDKAKRKGSDTIEYTTTDTNSAINDSNGYKEALIASKTNAVAFHIPAGQPVCRPPPKRFCDQTKPGRENISIDRLTEKQKMAERRKNQHVEQRLKRIHDRQEAARKLAHNVEILLQQRSLQTASRSVSYNTPQMTSSQLLATARNVARDFRTLSSQMTNDFAVDDKNNNLSRKSLSDVKTQEKKHSLVESSIIDNNRGIAFTVGFENDTQPVAWVPKAFQVPKKTHKTRLTAQDLEEKQRKAEERRNQRKQDRVKRVVANREALFKLASDLEAFMIWNDTGRHEPDTNEDDKKMRHQDQKAKLATEIADGFDRLSQKYARDLKQAEGFSCTSWSPKQLSK